MKKLVILIAISIMSLTFTFSSIAQVTNVSTEGTFVPNVWKKFRGDPVPDSVPDIIDWSYAGYKNGNEPIPDGAGLTIYSVTDYGAIANDNNDDTRAIRETIKQTDHKGGIVLFPPGQYDIFMNGPEVKFILKGHNIIVRGAGGAGAKKGGTTIKMHNPTPGTDVLDNHIFAVYFQGNGRQHSGGTGITRVVGSFPKGATQFNVENGNALRNRKYLEIYGPGLTGEDWAEHSSRSAEELPDIFELKSNGITIYEIHEIESVEGNTVTVKAPLLTHLNSNFQVYWRDLSENIGFEDLHIDGTLNEDYEHLVQRGSGGMILKYTAHSWVTECRFSNVIDSIFFANSYANTSLANITDGRAGHNSLTVTSSTYCLHGIYEDYTDLGIIHGITSTSAANGTVFYRIGGPELKGPDTHGDQARDTLLDNFHGKFKDSSGGIPEHYPSHLDGYVRWNNTDRDPRDYNLWGPPGLTITEAIIIGYKSTGGIIQNAYVESYGSHVYPESLYEAQVSRRLGVLPEFIIKGIEKYNSLYRSIFGPDVPIMTPVREKTP